MVDGDGYNWTCIKGNYTGMPNYDNNSEMIGNKGNGYAKITYIGKECENDFYNSCSDEVVRTTSWTGLVGLMSISDILYANGWLYNPNEMDYSMWTISPEVFSNQSSLVFSPSGTGIKSDSCSSSLYVGASVYLKNNIQVISGNGDTEPYILGL